jgi:hypothetical protein
MSGKVNPIELPASGPAADRTYGGGLYVDLIPDTAMYANLRTTLPSTYMWKRLGRAVKLRAGLRCEFCGVNESAAEGGYLVCHERFSYDASSGIQSLRRLIASCVLCDQVTHMGRFLKIDGGDPEVVVERLARVRRIERQAAAVEISRCWSLYHDRNHVEWTLDLGSVDELVCSQVRSPSNMTKASSGQGRPTLF